MNLNLLIGDFLRKEWSVPIIAILLSIFILFILPKLGKPLNYLLLGGIFFIIVFLIVPDKEKFIVFLFVFSMFLPINKRITSGPIRYFGSAAIYSIWLYDIFFIIGFFIFLGKAVSKQVKISALNKYDFFFFFNYLFCLLSFLNAIYLDIALYKFIYLIKYYLIFRWAQGLSYRKKLIQVSINTLLLIAFLNSLLGIYQYIFESQWAIWMSEDILKYEKLESSTYKWLYRVGGNFKANTAAQLYQITVPLFLAFILFGEKRKRWLMIIGFAVNVLGLIFTFSRSGWVATILGMLLVFYFSFLKSASFKEKFKRIFIFIFAILIMVGIGMLYFDIIKLRIVSSEDVSEYTRITMAKGALNMIKDHPFIGVGLNNYVSASPAYDYFAARYKIPIHNIFLLYGAETGVFRLIFFLLILISLFKDSYSNSSRTSDLFLKILNIGLSGGIIAMMFRMVFAMSFEEIIISSIFYYLAGFIVAIKYGTPEKFG